MEHIEELIRQASEAGLNRVATNTVAIVNSIRTVGYDPSTNRRGDGEDLGTGCAGRWGSHHFILTAAHVINERALPSDLRVFWRPMGGIERRSNADLRPEDIADGIPICDPRAVIYRCSWEDLAVVVIDPNEAGPHTEFFNISDDWSDPPEGETVHCCGFPFDRHILVNTTTIGNKEERTVAVRPGIFSGRVQPQPTQQELKFQFRAYDADRHYLIPYEHPDSGNPGGFSGAAMWWESDQKQFIWRPNFRFAGVCTHSYKKGSVVKVVKASVVRHFLEEVLGDAHNYPTLGKTGQG